MEVDETFIDGPRVGVRDRGAADKPLVAGAIEILETGWGRARLAIIDNANAETLRSFIQANNRVSIHGDHRRAELLPICAGWV